MHQKTMHLNDHASEGLEDRLDKTAIIGMTR